MSQSFPLLKGTHQSFLIMINKSPGETKTNNEFFPADKFVCVLKALFNLRRKASWLHQIRPLDTSLSDPKPVKNALSSKSLTLNFVSFPL